MRRTEKMHSIEPNLKKLGIRVERGRNHEGRWLRLTRDERRVVGDDENASTVTDDIPVTAAA